MEQTVRVRRLLEDGRAEVVHIRQSACSGDCHKCSGCGAAKETLVLIAQNPIGAAPGALVKVSSASAPVLGGAAVLYLLPLALFFAGCFLNPWCGGLGFMLGIAIALVYDRMVAAKKQPVYTITGYAEPSAPQNKGEKDHD